MSIAKYQLLGHLTLEQQAALEADIAQRGVQVPVEVDDQGNVLDGHHRVEIAQRLGKPYETIRRQFATEQEKREHVIKLNLCRRQLAPYQWGGGFKLLLKERGVERKAGPPCKGDNAATIAALVEQMGVSDRTARHRMAAHDAYEKLGPADQQQIEQGLLTVTQAKRTAKEAKRENRREANRQLIGQMQGNGLPQTARFATIVLDPPWDWGDEGDCDQLGRARPTYATMNFDAVREYHPCGDQRTIGDLAESDCHLYLWITNRSLPKGFTLLETWGFRYVTCLTWCKPSIGMGNYFRGSTEQILFGVRGNQPLKRKDAGTWFAAKRPGKHSAKPEGFYELVESCSPGPYLELFARKRRPGWVNLGAELTDAD